MHFFSIRRLLLVGIICLTLIWGSIFTMVLTDPSYQLFIPTISLPSWIQKLPDIQVEPTKNAPWKQDLFMGSGDINTFSGKSFLIHGTATPSAVFRDNSVVVYFNYYPSQDRKKYGSIFWIKSADQGRNWTQPAPIVISGLPPLQTYPISPQVVLLPAGKIKLYFLAKAENAPHNKLYAAISSDGVNFNYDPSTNFEIENESLIAFTVAILDERMHMVAFTKEGSTTNTAYNAISYDTKVFTRLADLTIEDAFYGQSHLVVRGKNLYLIGSSSKGLWRTSSSDGNVWSNPAYFNLPAQNPTAVNVGEKFLLFYTDNPTTDLSDKSADKL